MLISEWIYMLLDILETMSSHHRGVTTEWSPDVASLNGLQSYSNFTQSTLQFACQSPAHTKVSHMDAPGEELANPSRATVVWCRSQ